MNRRKCDQRIYIIDAKRIAGNASNENRIWNHTAAVKMNRICFGGNMFLS